MSFIAAMLLMFMSEEEAFWVLVSLADDTKYQMANLWLSGRPDLKLRYYQMDRLVKSNLPKLAAHLEKDYQDYTTRASLYGATYCFITLFTAREHDKFEFGLIARIWDIYLNEGLVTIFRMGLGYLKYVQDELPDSGIGMEEMIDILQKAREFETEKYIKLSMSFRITEKQLNRLEQDYERSKNTFY